uniref:Transposase (putative) gypsy type domain-containing protein n=1 Tax=Cajanus cajan TaxID=3821 RepID=A0A151UAH0_CAJCA|nr:hypothetical protein KK1_020561 [Cajanus cajan]
MGKSTDPPHFYVYQCFFRDLGICLPFTQFECDFLNFVNLAPCQLHPNSWGFLRAFQVLCSALGIEVSLRVFLHFYQLKIGVSPYGVLSLSGRTDGGLFTLYSQSYKNYKQEFFRVALVDVDPLEDGAFYFGGLPKFPFYWCRKSSRFHGVGQLKLTASEATSIENLVALPRPLDCKLVLSLANSAYKERGLESEYLVFFRLLGFVKPSFSDVFYFPFASIMGKSKWRELKHRYNIVELEVPKPQEEEMSPLKVNRKRKRGDKEVGGTSVPRGAEEVTSKAADADAVDLTGSPPPGEAP